MLPPTAAVRLVALPVCLSHPIPIHTIQTYNPHLSPISHLPSAPSFLPLSLTDPPSVLPGPPSALTLLVITCRPRPQTSPSSTLPTTVPNHDTPVLLSPNQLLTKATSTLPSLASPSTGLCPPISASKAVHSVSFLYTPTSHPTGSGAAAWALRLPPPADILLQPRAASLNRNPPSGPATRHAGRDTSLGTPLTPSTGCSQTASLPLPTGLSRHGQMSVNGAPSAPAHGPDSSTMPSRRSSYPLSAATEAAARAMAINARDGRQANAAAADSPDPADTIAVADTDGAFEGDVAVDGPPLAASVSPPQLQLNEYREKLARDLERREHQVRGLVPATPTVDKIRTVVPIQEEPSPSPPWASSNLNTSSTESGNTVRGAMTPAILARTPSYPFPRMATTPTAFSPSQPFVNTANPASRINIAIPQHEPRAVLERVLSETSTPASAFSFNPGATHMPESIDFPSPDLYNLSLLLSSEPGLDAWWNTVIQIMRDVFQAERVTLSVPADAADLENVPWGQKATYNEHQEDELSLGYMAKGSSAVQSSNAEAADALPSLDDLASPAEASPVRPGLHSRHSFTSYEEKKDPMPTTPRRPNHLSRSKTSAPVPSRVLRSGTRLDRTKLEEHDSQAQEGSAIPSWEIPFLARYEGQGRVHSVLQALDFEADPLLDHAGVVRVLERGGPVTLTRSYPYLLPNNREMDASKMAAADSLKKAKINSSESLTSLSSILPTASTKPAAKGKQPATIDCVARDDEQTQVATPRYEEYEQVAASPWAQSPAPSPAIRSDTAENPFFAEAIVDEGSFDPATGAADYTDMRPPEAIGLDNSWTVLHIPLTHVLQSRQTRPFKLDATNMEQRLHGQRPESPPSLATDSKKNKPAPIAILSLLSTVTPYPPNLRKSLEHLSPHMATSFSLARHYTNLETELAGIQRRRPPTTGFGAVAPYGRSYESTAALASADIIQLRSTAGSITSPSDYSAVSKSAAGSPIGTPGWKRQPIPSPAALSGGDSYFNSKSTLAGRPEAINSGVQRSKSSSVEISPGDKRSSRLPGSSVLYGTMEEDETPLEKPGEGIPVQHRKSRSASSAEPVFELGEAPTNSLDEKIEAERHVSQHQRPQNHPHTMLHSYGADFASTFQSLPPSSSLMSRPSPTPLAPGQSRSMSAVSAAAGDMPPPSDRLKSLILDSLPAHVFVSLPQTGEIVWVNSRYLSYRGQTVNSLAADPWKSLHPDDRDEYLKDWGHSLRTGDQFSRTVRIKRFDGAYRWFYARAVASKDKRGVIMQFLGSYMDIHDQHIAELKAARQEEIEASEAKHRLLANLIPQIIFTATEDDGVTFANEQWLSYTGQSFEDALGLGFMDFVHPEDLAKCRIPITRPCSDATLSQRAARRGSDSGSRSVRFGHKSTVTSSTYEMPTADLAELAKKGIVRIGTDTNGRVSYTTELRLRSKNGDYRWHLIRCVEIDTIDFGRGASSYFGSATDINDHKLLEAKLKEAMESKGRFLSNMSHEIRTPLIGISGMASFLQDTTLDEEQRDYTTTIQTSANSLIMIINDILDLSKADAGMMKLNFEWFRARSIMEDVNELVSTMAIGKGLELNYLVEADVPLWVKGDKIRIRQVLLNVVGNAIKFTDTGEVFSRCKIYTDTSEPMGEHEIMLEFSITDTGRGFTKKEAELIFKPFSQIDGSSTRQHGGSGLGLVISRQLVELHGGKLEGTAAPGEGSTFTFTARFNLPTAHDQPNLPQSPGSTISTFSRQESEGGLRGSPQLSATLKRRSTDEASPSEAASGSLLARSSSPRMSGLSRTAASSQASGPLVGVNPGLARFSEAAKASGHDLSQMRLEIPGRDSLGRTATPDHVGRPRPTGIAPPPVYSILVICPQHHSREATVQHIEMTLPKDVPHEITAIPTIDEAHDLIGGNDPVTFSHIVINLGSAEAILAFLAEVTTLQKLEKTVIVILSDSLQRTAVMKAATGTPTEQTLESNSVTFIYKPVKPSRFAVIFDPDKRRDLSTDWNRSTAQQLVERQKASYTEMSMRMGHKGYKVLVVEDNKINQKVLTKYLEKIGVEVEIAEDGVECTELVFNKPHNYYSLILCDIQMPHKDGYETCRDIREWEARNGFDRLPIIALSANVMSVVFDKCTAAGFSDYVTKPVDFISLSKAMVKYFS
ncbi:autoinducer 2 sensor kinase/phosphatase luxQ [Cordyceps fumosorosea ARSEF 2679]|uniref:Autoinducer 2 sensor kinase/phosphatase luxQ n=1 Tax=Cordyceps fumosorosea (strain ARSEF 2679) TaxID=1081104 RepID=A0A167R1N6_CORFA|nr:autoinducer 2 sensor kinase/phosphatase luxQ [Cordyceps fumosorosea ARSEF 2679]OAA58186.1 autoinducer 2 sensor kinase/phosphatase luxQ [Cordyceps fumosorosea ARSEF 2679]